MQNYGNWNQPNWAGSWNQPQQQNQGNQNQNESSRNVFGATPSQQSSGQFNQNAPSQFYGNQQSAERQFAGNQHMQANVRPTQQLNPFMMSQQNPFGPSNPTHSGQKSETTAITQSWPPKQTFNPVRGPSAWNASTNAASANPFVEAMRSNTGNSALQNPQSHPTQFVQSRQQSPVAPSSQILRPDINSTTPSHLQSARTSTRFQSPSKLQQASHTVPDAKLPPEEPATKPGEQQPSSNKAEETTLFTAIRSGSVEAIPGLGDIQEDKSSTYVLKNDLKSASSTDLNKTSEVKQDPDVSETKDNSSPTSFKTTQGTAIASRSNYTQPVATSVSEQRKSGVLPHSSTAYHAQKYDENVLKDFDEKFAAWEDQFESWKQTNLNHKNQPAYNRYVEQYTKWQMDLRKQRSFILREIEKEKKKKIQEAELAQRREMERMRHEAAEAVAKMRMVQERQTAPQSQQQSPVFIPSQSQPPRFQPPAGVPFAQLKSSAHSPQGPNPFVIASSSWENPFVRVAASSGPQGPNPFSIPLQQQGGSKPGTQPTQYGTESVEVIRRTSLFDSSPNSDSRSHGRNYVGQAPAPGIPFVRSMMPPQNLLKDQEELIDSVKPASVERSDDPDPYSGDSSLNDLFIRPRRDRTFSIPETAVIEDDLEDSGDAAVIDYGHGGGDIQDDISRYVEREAPEGEEEGDNFEAVTIDYGHGGGEVEIIDDYDDGRWSSSYPSDYYDRGRTWGPGQPEYEGHPVDNYGVPYPRHTGPDQDVYEDDPAVNRYWSDHVAQHQPPPPPMVHPRVAPPRSPGSSGGSLPEVQELFPSASSDRRGSSRDSRSENRGSRPRRDSDRDNHRSRRDTSRDRDRYRRNSRDRARSPRRDRSGNESKKRSSNAGLPQDRLMPKDVETISSDDENATITSKTSLAGSAVPPHLTDTAKLQVVLIEDIVSVYGRKRRPPRIVIILRGLPGSGKSFAAKLIKDREQESGGGPPRILSLDDYFMTEEKEKIVKDPTTGKDVKEVTTEYEYDAEAEASYRQDLIKTFKKTIDNGFFPFIIVDGVNDKLEYFAEMADFAAKKRFQVYVADVVEPVEDCVRRNIHGRTKEDILKLQREWEPTPNSYVKLDVRTLLQDEAISDVEMEDVYGPKPPPEVKCSAVQEIEEEDEASKTEQTKDDENGESSTVISKWEKIEAGGQKLNKLDGLMVRKRKAEETMEELNSIEAWLQRNVPDDYTCRAESRPGQKRVRWADIEERRKQERMREIGFVIGADWNRMMDPNAAESALTKTKFI